MRLIRQIRPIKKIRLIFFLFSALLAAGILIFLFSYFSKSASAAWYSDNWHFRKKLTIDYTKVSGGSDLSNFPVLVSLTDSSLRKAQSDGDDILFTSSDGSTKLNHEIESFTQSSGILVAWVQVTTLSASANTDIYMYYGNSSAASQQSVANTWNEGGNNNFRGVWHLDETGNGTSGEYVDSTTNANNGQGGSGSADAVPSNTSGMIGSSQSFDGSNDLINFGSPSTLDYPSAWTYEAWIRPTQISGNRTFIDKGTNGTRYKYISVLSDGTLRSTFWDVAGSASLTTSSNTLSANQWVHVVTSCNPDNNPDCKIYINGTEVSYSGTGNATTNGDDSSGNFWVGYGRLGYFYGQIDEVRFSNSVRTAGWITTEYNNQNDPGSFFSSKGVEEVKKGPILSWHFDEGQGTTANDSGQAGMTGTLNNTPTWQTEDLCISGKCLYFDGTNNENVSKADDALLDFGATNNFSVSAWVKRSGTSSAINYILSKHDVTDDAEDGGYKLYMDATGDLCFGIDDDITWDPDVSACTSGVDFDDNQWHYVTGVRDQTGTDNVILYVDGKQRAVTADSTSVTLANSNIFYVGVDRDGTSNEWLGFIDEVKVYDFALSAAEVKANFASRGSVKGSSTVIASEAWQSLSNGLVGYWKMDESSWNGTSNEVVDASGNGNHGTSTCTGGGCTVPTTATGKFGNGGSFDGTQDYIELNSPSTLDLNRNFTISAWVNMDNAANNTEDIISHGHNEWELRHGAGGGFQLLDANTEAILTSSTAISTSGTWYLVTVTVSSGTTATVNFYLNGKPDGSTTTTATLNNGSQSVIIGGSKGGVGDLLGLFDGKIDEVRVYNRALSPKEVSDLYNFAPGPVVYYKMDDKVSGDSKTLVDSSGNGNNATTHWGSAGMDCTKSGKYGGGCYFDGTDDYISGPSLGTLGALTIEFWFNPDAIEPNGGTVRKIIGSSDFGLQFGDWAGSSFNYLNDVGWENSIWNTGFTAKSWQHVAVTFNSGTYHTYVNGVEKSYIFGNSPTRTTRTINSLTIADSSTDFQGYMDDVKIYNYARTQKQIIADMNGGNPSTGSGPRSGAIAHYRFDEGYSTTANDTTPNDNDLTLSSASWTNSGKFGKAWNGDGTLWVSRTNDADLDFNATDDFTISGWFKSDSATNPSNGTEYIISTTTGNTDAGYSIYANTNGTICFGIDDDTTWGPDVSSCTTADYYDGNWHHFTAIRNVTTDKTYIYIDALEKDSDTDTTTATLDGDNVFYVGDFDGDNNATSGTEEFAGDIDELKVYRYALTADEAKTEYNRGSSLVLGALGTNSTYQSNASNQEYCVPGDSTSCAAPVGEWKFEEGSGGSVNDSSGNANTGTWAGTGSHWTTGKYGGAGNFNGSDDYVDMGTSASTLLNRNFTIEGWVYNNNSTGTLIGHGNSNWVVRFNGAKALDLQDGNVADILVGNTSLQDNKWYHFAAVVSSGATATVTLYLNGIQDGTTTTAAELNTNAGHHLTIGNDYNSGGGTMGSYLNGKIDEVKIYNYARTPAQIAWDYNKGTPIAYWKLNECQGATANDSSGNGYTGTWTAGTTYTGAGTCTDGLSSSAWYGGRNGKFNASLDFDGTATNRVTVSSAISGVQSVSFWVKPTTNTDSFMDFDGGTHYITASSGTVSATGFSSPTIYVNGAVNGQVTANAWNHVVVTTGTAFNTTSSFTMGYKSAATADYLTGQLDDIQIFNYALTATQVKNLYNNGAVNYAPSSGNP